MLRCILCSCFVRLLSLFTAMRSGSRAYTSKPLVCHKVDPLKASQSNCPHAPRSTKQTQLSFLSKISSFTLKTVVIASSLGSRVATVSAAVKTQQNDFPTGPVSAFQTGSGLIYIDLNNATQGGTTPLYGQFISFYYTMYYRPSKESPLQFIDATKPGEPFLQKHGNGRIIQGIEETLHTMTVGARRRAILPRSLGYAKFGLGPLPVEPGTRRKLGRILDAIDEGKGELVFDLELVNIRDDENDQGYYEDVPVSQKEVRQMVQSLQTNSPELMESVKGSIPAELFPGFDN